MNLRVDVFFAATPHMCDTSHTLIFGKHTQANKLGGGLTIYPMTIGQGLDA
jgi:hypothetical protein